MSLDAFLGLVGVPLFLACLFGWIEIEIGAVGWVLLIWATMVVAVVHIAFGLLGAVADLLAGRRD